MILLSLLMLLLVPASVVADVTQIIVPVTLTYQGRAVTAPMAVDTGATTTTIDTRLADRLGIQTTGRGWAQMADGRAIPFGSATVIVSVAGISRRIDVNVMDYRANRQANGMLGLNFMASSGMMTIDWSNNKIYWSE